MTTPLLGAAIGGGIGLLKRDPAKYALWGAGIGFLVTLVGGAAVSVGGISVRVGAEADDGDFMVGRRTGNRREHGQDGGRGGRRPERYGRGHEQLGRRDAYTHRAGIQSGPAIVGAPYSPYSWY